MQIFKKYINYKYGDTITIKPIADIHLGHKTCDIEGFKKYLEINDSPNTYFIGVGDFLDSIITKDLKRYRKSMDNSDSQDIIDEQIEKGRKLLWPYRDRILLLSEGNHEETICAYGTNPIKRLCNELECDYAGYDYMLNLVFRENGARVRTVTIYTHHGWGGGARTEGADITKFSNHSAFYDADIFCYGHVHKKQFAEVPRLGIVGGKLISKPKIVCICGTFQKVLSDTNDPSWAETKGFAPRSIGGLEIHIKPTRTWVDIKVET